MGGCSSKPKTAEFEGDMDLQDDTPQGEAKSLEGEKISVDARLKGIDREESSSERSIQTLVTERKQDDLRDMFAGTEKQMIAGFSPESNLKEESQVLEDDRQHVKQILGEIINDSGVEKGLSLKEEILKLHINPEVLAVELQKKPVFIVEVTKKLQGTPLLATIKAETVETEQERLTLSKGTLENEEKDVFSESKTLSLKDICIGTDEDASKLQVKLMGPQDRLLELSKNLSVGEEEILELQEPFFPEDVDLGLQKDPPTEASSNGRVESEYHKAVSKNEEQRLDDSVGHGGQDKQFGEGSKNCEDSFIETEAGACDVVNAASGGVLALERGEKVLKDSSKLIWEDEIKGAAVEEAAEEFINGTCIVSNSPIAEASDQDPSREINSADAVHRAITTDVRPINLQHVVNEQDSVQEEQEVDVDASYEVAMKGVLPRADIHRRVNDFLVKESNVETLDTTDREGEPISAKISMDDKHLSPLPVVSEESSCVQLPLENYLGEVQEQKSYAAVITVKGQRKLDASCTPDEFAASQVIATTKKPEDQSVHVMEFSELAFIPAQDIPAPDIDEVLEKLASEFERQESLARATS